MAVGNVTDVHTKAKVEPRIWARVGPGNIQGELHRLFPLQTSLLTGGAEIQVNFG